MRLHPTVHVPGEAGLLGTARASRSPGPIIRVVRPATFRVNDVWLLFKLQQPLPLRGGIAAVHRFRPVERRVATRNEIGVEIRNVALGVGKERVVRRICVKLHCLVEARQIRGLGPRVALHQCLERLLHDANGHPPAAGGPHDRPEMRVVDHELLLSHSTGGGVRHRNGLGDQRLRYATDRVHILIATFRHGFQEFVAAIGRTGGVHPAGFAVEALIDKELTPGGRTVGV